MGPGTMMRGGLDSKQGVKDQAYRPKRWCRWLASDVMLIDDKSEGDPIQRWWGGGGSGGRMG